MSKHYPVVFVASIFAATLFMQTVFGQTALEEPSSTAEKPRESYLLRYRFHKGEEMQWNVVQTIRVTTAIGGISERLETSSRSTKIWEVRELSPDGTGTLDYSVRDVVMSQKQTNKPDASFDSRTDTVVPQMFRSVAESLGVPLSRLSINDRGETVKKLYLRSYTPNLQENKIAIPLPKEPVAVGDHWEFPLPIELQRADGTVKKIRAEEVYTLKDVKTGLATVAFEVRVFSPVSDPKERIELAKHLEKGTLKLDVDTGHVVSRSTTIDEHVTGFAGAASTHHNQTRREECCCGFPTCRICNP